MRPASHGALETRLIGAPVGWDPAKDGDCGALSVFDWQNPAGYNEMISRWELEPGDLEKLQSGAPIFLSVFGQAHPVVCVYVGEQAPLPADATTGTSLTQEDSNG